MSINVPIQDILHVARVIQQIQKNPPMHDPGVLFVAVDEGKLELRQGPHISYGVRTFDQVDPRS